MADNHYFSILPNPFSCSTKNLKVHMAYLGSIHNTYALKSKPCPLGHHGIANSHTFFILPDLFLPLWK